MVSTIIIPVKNIILSFQTLIVQVQSGNEFGGRSQTADLQSVSNPYRTSTVREYDKKCNNYYYSSVSNPYRTSTVRELTLTSFYVWSACFVSNPYRTSTVRELSLAAEAARRLYSLSFKPLSYKYSQGISHLRNKMELLASVSNPYRTSTVREWCRQSSFRWKT